MIKMTKCKGRSKNSGKGVHMRVCGGGGGGGGGGGPLTPFADFYLIFPKYPMTMK